MGTNDSLPDPLKITLQVTRILEDLQIPYFIGGSLASALYGTVRATMDADLVVDLNVEKIQQFAAQLDPAFYFEPSTILDALQHGRSFNLIHRDTMFKVDIFPKTHQPFENSQMQRRVLKKLSNQPEDRAYFTTAEDIILAKLVWFRLGGETSDHQWKDVLGVLQIQKDQLDAKYIHYWANQLNLVDLLERALNEYQASSI
jgi:hypothetical protein